MTHFIDIESNEQFVLFGSYLHSNIYYKLGYDFITNVEQSSLPLIGVGQMSTRLFSNRDEINITYHCMLNMAIKLECFASKRFLVIVKPELVYGISNSHPDNINTDMESLDVIFEQEEIKNIVDAYKIIEFGIHKAIDKSINELKEWKEQQKKQTLEYLLKE